MTKLCTSCNEIKELSKFNKNKTKKDGLATTCRSCMKVYRKAHYERTKDTYMVDILARRKDRKKIIVEKLLQFFLENPCVDCGNSDPRVLEFDHIDPSQKSIDVSKMLAGDYSWDTVMIEVAKCEVRCANCHRIRTSKQFDTYRAYWDCGIDVMAA